MNIDLKLKLPKDMHAAAAALREAICAARQIIIAGEATPDPDCAGSQLALRYVIRQLNPDCGVALINDHGCSQKLSWLANAKKLRAPRPKDRNVDCVIFVDGGLSRCGQRTQQTLQEHPKQVIIDHHQSTDVDQYQIALNDPAFASTTELIATLAAHWQVPISRKCAIAIYVGLIADTGNFQFSNTTTRSFELAAQLTQLDIDTAELARRVLLTVPRDYLILQQRVLRKVRFCNDSSLLIARIDFSDLRGLKLGDIPSDYLLRQLAYIEGVDVTALLKSGPRPTKSKAEVKPWRKISLRSTGSCNVVNLAKHLNPEGGGHAKAAGCRVEGTDQSIVDRIIHWHKVWRNRNTT